MTMTQATTQSATYERTSDDRAGRTARLLTEAARTEGRRRRALLDEAVHLNLPVARSLASRYRNRGQPVDDLEQVASLALTMAVHGFDPTQGKDFLSYAVPTIRGELKRYFRDTAWAVRPPRRVQEVQTAMPEARSELSQELGRTPTAPELADRLGCRASDVTEAWSSDHCFSPVSLEDRGRERDGRAWLDVLGDDERGFERAEAIAMLAPACRDLPDRDQQIVFLRFYEEWSQGRIAREIGVSQVQVSRLLTKILATLRAQVVADAP